MVQGIAATSKQASEEQARLCRRAESSTTSHTDTKCRHEVSPFPQATTTERLQTTSQPCQHGGTSVIDWNLKLLCIERE